MRKRSVSDLEQLLERADDYIDGGVTYSPTFAVVDINGNTVGHYQKVNGELVKSEKDHPDAVMLPVKLEEFLRPRKFKVAFGGRGSAKTRTIASLLVVKARTEKHRILCCREIQGSIADSSYQELIDEIERRGCLNEFRITNTKIVHKKTKTVFMFRGLHRNWTSIKGIAGLTLIWVEEAENISRKSWDVLVPTLRGCDDAEIWVSFNPDKETDATYGDFVLPHITELKSKGGVYVDKSLALVKINYTDNPWFPKVLQEEMERCRTLSENRYLNIWEGHLTKPESEIIKEDWWYYYEDWNEVYSRCHAYWFTADTAYCEDESADNSVLMLVGTDGVRLYVLATIKGKWGFPELLEQTKRFMDKFPEANKIYIEAKASGHSLAQSLRRKGIDSIPWLPAHYGFPKDKTGRVQESAWSVYNGDVWLPYDTTYIEPLGCHGKQISEPLVYEASMFSTEDLHDSDDILDCLTCAISIFLYYKK